MVLIADYEGFLISPVCLKPPVLTLLRATCKMSDSSLSADIETLVTYIFDDDLDVMANIQNAAGIMRIDNGRCIITGCIREKERKNKKQEAPNHEHGNGLSRNSRKEGDCCL